MENKFQDMNAEITEKKADRVIRDAIDGLGPDERQMESMWRKIERSADMAEALAASRAADERKRAARRPVFARMIAAAAAVLLVIGGISLAQGGSGTVPSITGYVYAAESRVTDMTPEEVLIAAGDAAESQEMYVYAPAVYYADGHRIVFGNGEGLIIYDLGKRKVEGMIDMQAICSGYYNTDSVRTHVFVDGDDLIVYNTENPSGSSGEDSTPGRPFGFWHTFDLSRMDEGGASGGLLTCSGSGNEKDIIKGYIEKGGEYESAHLADAWDNVVYLQSPEMDECLGRDGGKYSENAYIYTDEEGREVRCLLVYRGTGKAGGYELLSEFADGSGHSAAPLELGITDSVRASVREKNILPAYVYSGDDPVMRAVTEYMTADGEGWYDDNGTCIPVPEIIAQEESGGELLVFGVFNSDRYIKRGNTMISISGGRVPGCYHLRKTAGGYEVAEAVYAEDGEGYEDSIRNMTEGFPGLYNKMMKSVSGGVNEESRRDTIRTYVEANGLGIEYYKDYGWDPVKLG